MLHLPRKKRTTRSVLTPPCLATILSQMPRLSRFGMFAFKEKTRGYRQKCCTCHEKRSMRSVLTPPCLATILYMTLRVRFRPSGRVRFRPQPLFSRPEPILWATFFSGFAAVGLEEGKPLPGKLAGVGGHRRQPVLNPATRQNIFAGAY